MVDLHLFVVIFDHLNHRAAANDDKLIMKRADNHADVDWFDHFYQNQDQ